jgi:hypothetical protein
MRPYLGLALLCALAAPWSVAALESRLPTHLLVQMPLLVVAGALLAPLLERVCRAPAHGGPGMALAIAAASVCMLPRSMDAAFESAWADAAKFAALTLGVGMPLARSWPLLGAVARGFLLGNFLPMLYVLGWLYTSAPMRVCSYYLKEDQAHAGVALFCIASALTLWLTARCFMPAPSGIPKVGIPESGRPESDRVEARHAATVRSADDAPLLASGVTTLI